MQSLSSSALGLFSVCACIGGLLGPVVINETGDTAGQTMAVFSLACGAGKPVSHQGITMHLLLLYHFILSLSCLCCRLQRC